MGGIFSETADLRHAAHVAAMEGNQEGVFAVRDKIISLADRPGLSAEDLERINMVREIADIYGRIALNPGKVVDLV